MLARRRGIAWLRETRGAQLLEVALVLPLLLVLAVGILDFGTAYNLRQILNNAAREGARLGAAQQGLSGDLTQAQPPSVQAICNDVVAYLWQARVDLTFLGSLTPGGTGAPPTCPAPTAAASTTCPSPAATAFTWVYPSGAAACGTGLTIERQVPVADPSVGTIISTRVTLNYPYNWLYGFNRIIGFANPGTTTPGTISISTNALMANIN